MQDKYNLLSHRYRIDCCIDCCIDWALQGWVLRTGFALSGSKRSGVAHVGAANGIGHGVGLAWNNAQVDVVGHQAVRLLPSKPIASAVSVCSFGVHGQISPSN